MMIPVLIPQILNQPQILLIPMTMAIKIAKTKILLHRLIPIMGKALHQVILLILILHLVILHNQLIHLNQEALLNQLILLSLALDVVVSKQKVKLHMKSGDQTHL